MLAPAGALAGIMEPPKNAGDGQGAKSPAGSPAVSLCVIVKRSDFLKAAGARRQGTDGFLLQARNRQDGMNTKRVGFTASKKIGNAVTRNRAKRRLRALAREVLAPLAHPGWDYVLVARPQATVTRAYEELCADLQRALGQVHRS